ncbi:MAG TPA: cation:dicarboxylase symporter family transporter, partial [Methanocorpusculum sp.]|nr:cation:dicarboxylase symporter family transporter [Methanocorpusculum sp.]
MAVSAKTLTFRLSKDAVGQISSLTAEALKEGDLEVYDVERLHLAVEQVLLKWLDVLGEGTEGTYRSGKRLGRQYINLSVSGPRVNPFGEDGGDCVLNGGNSVQTLLANIGLTPSYHYVNGENQIALMPKRKKINPLIYLIFSIVAGVFAGLLCRELPYEIRHTFSTVIVTPLFDTFIGLLIATALPMMFLSLIWGIYSIGDTATLGNIGKRVIGRYLGRIYFTLIICALVCLPFFEYAASGSAVSGGEFTAIFSMILNIVPS